MQVSTPHQHIVVWPNAAYTDATDGTSAVFESNGFKGCILDIDVSNVSATITLDFKIQAVDPFDNTKKTDLKGAAVTQFTTNGHKTLIVYPGIAVNAGETISNVMPSLFCVVFALSASDTANVWVNATLLP